MTGVRHDGIGNYRVAFCVEAGVSVLSAPAIWPAASRRVGAAAWHYLARTPATKAFTSLDNCSACFDRSDAAVRT